ncbi:MAG: diphosphomevalonate decarboxylase [Candidatus Micrarchaeota archaeon]|nr:MAG: diphosphomevalonate decarboxylase [Candidatus Micrarchaeota archaeon]
MKASAIGPSNIAFVKYWGKRDERLILPFNSSLSMTLSPYTLDNKPFHTITTVEFSSRLDRDSFIINGLEQPLDKEHNEAIRVIEILKELADAKEMHFRVESFNSFPTAAGLASSASGISALTVAASKALGLNLSRKELSVIARQGSGSACRSITGGLSLWHKGELDDGSDSYSEELISSNDLDLVDIVMVLSNEEKKIKSRAGMKTTVSTSRLFRSRVDIAEQLISEILSSIKNKDYHKLYELIMKESNNFHAVLMDTYPPIIYLSDRSKEVIYKVHEINKDRNICAYTFDAGQNPHIITDESNLDKVVKLISDIESDAVYILKPGDGAHLVDKSLF